MTTGKERARWRQLNAWPCLPFAAIGFICTDVAGSFQPDARAVDALAYALVLAAALTLAAYRYPGLCLTLNGAMVAVYLAAGYPFGPVQLTIPAAVYHVAARWPVGRASLGVVAHLAVVIAASWVNRMRESTGVDVTGMWWRTLIWGGIGVVAFGIGVLVRAHREAVAGKRAEQARRVASEEQLRMAQDLHDSIGHGLAVIAMQTGVALHVLDRDPQEARMTMQGVRATSRESLDNLRAALETLRRPVTAERHPAHGLGDLEQLTDRVRAGGVTLHVDVAPDLPAVSSTVDAAAYRILQESLTNVLRHAGATTARIRVWCEHGTLLLDVTDTGRAGVGDSAPTGGLSSLPGSGIRGMRAQAEALGGTLRAGPRRGGFAVAARLPLRGGEVQ